MRVDSFEIEGQVIEVLQGCGMASIASPHGVIYTINRQTPGIVFTTLHEGVRVRCQVGGEVKHVLHAELVQRSGATPPVATHPAYRAEPPDHPPALPVGAGNQWDVFLQTRIETIDWLRSETNLNDGEIAKALSMTATAVFLIRTRQRQGTAINASDSANTQAAPLGQ
jgi:hypothetical protein